MNTEKIMENIQSVQDNIREIKSTWGNTIMTLDNIKSGLKADMQKKVDEAYQRGLAEGKKAFDLLDAERDAEYQKGFEDGKKSAEKGCEGCKYEHVDEGSNPCCICAKGYIDHYEPAPHSDRIEKGDIVDRYIDGNFDGRGIYLGGNDEIWNCLFWANTLPITLAFPKEQFKMTGKHYDIQSILEAMKS